MTRTRRALLLALAAAAALTLTTPALALPGTLVFDRVLPGTFQTSECVNGSVKARCFLVALHGTIPGLGAATVSERVLQSGELDEDQCEPQSRFGTITSAHGTIDYVANGIDCPATRMLNGGYRAVVVDWKVVGGTGAYAAATGFGSASVRPEDAEVFIHLHGTIVVPDHEFDVRAPIFVASPRVVRVNGPVARFAAPVARDLVDGVVAVACSPKSGARLAPGRRTITCSATDSSGNTARRSFTLIVGKGPQ